ncbi:unnamed protein product [Cercopithifilaria johnstoni]|uniref:Uncharacterized protein n=1 Tax=Cercopithifilaria johnstoni TaxID=2874296 RepID=A0A8J2M7J5_9BILA|nr:unnamed protein product [Cercopithifilaria johnstoni]
MLSLRNDVWAYYFKTRKWYDVIVHGEIPPERFQHTACVIDEKMYVYGGIDSARRQLYLDVLNLRKSCWEKLDEGGQKPCGIRAACSWVHDNKMYIFGGYRGEYYITTLHRFDPKTLVWHEMKPFGLSGPIGRERHCAVIVGDCVYVFSGLASVVSLTGNVGFGCLMEMCDLNVLSYNWTLKNLASIAVLRYQLNFMQSVELPVELKIYLNMMIRRNDVL